MTSTKKRICHCEKNFCCYNSILLAFGDQYPSANFWATPIGMKNFLNIGRADPIEVKHVPLLESKLKVCINIVGDDEYVSECKYPKRITLTLRNGHYSFFGKKNCLTKIWKEGKTYVMFKKFDDHFLTYDGEELVADFTLTYSQMQWCQERIYKQINGISDEDSKTLTQLKKEERFDEYEELIGEVMVKVYDDYLKNCEHLKLITNGLVDVQKNGYNIKDTALSIFARFVNAYDVQPIDEKEYSVLSQIKNHGLLYAKPSTITGRCIDGNSWYPAIMSDPKLIVPLGNPEYITLETLPAIIAYGLYKVDIENHDKRLFVKNPASWYTYIDVKEAIRRGYDVKLVCDGSFNHVHYNSQNRESANYLFRGFVDLLYPFKKQNPLVKRILNILWGALCQRVKKFQSEAEAIAFDFEDHGEEENDDNAFFTKFEKYKLHWARVGVFVTAMGRKKLADYIEDVVDEVFRIHTDGFYTTSEKEFKLSNELGGFKLEAEGTFVITNLNDIKSFPKRI